MFLADLTAFIVKTQSEKSKTAFPWNEAELGQYLSWAFSRNYLFVESDENGINGVLVAYPINWVFTNELQNLLPSDTDFTPEQESHKHLCVMDGIFSTSEVRKKIALKFFKRFPNWKNQAKWCVRKGNITELNNRYFDLASTIL